MKKGCWKQGIDIVIPYDSVACPHSSVPSWNFIGDPNMVSYYNHALSMFPTPGPTAPTSATASGGHRSMGGGGSGGASSAASAAAAAVAAQSAYFPAAAAAGYGYHHPTAHQQFPGASQYPSLSDLNSNMYTAAAAAQFGPSAAGSASAFDTSWGWPYNSCRGSTNAVASYDGWQPAPATSTAVSTNSPVAEVQNSSVSEGGGVAATSSTTSDGNSPNDSDPAQPAQQHPPSGSPSGYTTAPGPNSQSSGAVSTQRSEKLALTIFYHLNDH